MATKKKDYSEEDIVLLEGADRVRKKPAVIFGSDGLEGCQHAVFEIVSNAIDEARAGHGRRIIVTRGADDSVSVQDFGRGLPVDYNPNYQRYNWELLFCELYAGGKYNNEEAGNYSYSLGTNGLGLCATQYASEYMDAEIYNGEYRYTLHFEKGVNIGGMTKEPCKTRKTGSTFRWRPDREVFTEISIPFEWLEDMLRRQAIVNAGVTFELHYEGKDGSKIHKEYVYEKGLSDYLEEIKGERALTEVQTWACERTGRDREDRADYKVVMEMALCFTKDKSLQEFYHNSSFLEHGGSPEKAVRLAFTGQIDAYMKQSGKYLKAEKSIKFEDIQDCLIFVSSTFSNQASFENQTKKSVQNKFIQTAMTDYLKHQIEIWFTEKPEDAQAICDQILINKRSRESAEKTRVATKGKLTEKIDIANRVEKFIDCRSKDKSQREIFIVEGDSAMGACKQARDAEFQAIIPVRGKILNCLKAGYDKIFGSKIITNVIKVLGCGVEVSSRANKELSSFNLDNLRWSKIIICTDADEDGYQIRTLILTMLYRLTPTLIEQGYVYIAESPLYEITSKDETYFAYNEQEKANILAALEGKKVSIQRSKGLGENEPPMMRLTTMDPATRRLIRVCPEEAEKTAAIFDIFLGDNLEGRKNFISEHGAKYLDAADLS